jgi:hypothetical protein
MSDRLLHQHARVSEARATELTTQWTRYSIQLAVNTGVLYGFVERRDHMPDLIETLWVIFGALLSLLWIAINDRGHKWVGFWNRWLRDIEPQAGLPLVFTDALSETKGSFLPIVVLSGFLPLLFLLAWAALTFVIDLGTGTTAARAVTIVLATLGVCCLFAASRRTRRER